jgi:hypothetical protein
MVAGDGSWACIRLITPGGFGIRVQQFIDLEVIFIVVVQTPKNEKKKAGWTGEPRTSHDP